jgi:hypothetical protein
MAVWAGLFGVHPQTAYRWFREDRMPVPARRLPGGDDRGRGATPGRATDGFGEGSGAIGDLRTRNAVLVEEHRRDQLVIEDPIKDGGRD